jgi:drug/metabolite transporter (DMT)-like permease
MIEIPLVLALASAMAWGAGDFFGGLATRDAKAVGTTFISQAIGLLGLIFVSLVGAGGALVWVDLAWGTAAGLCAMTGLGLFYEAMGRGSFGPVASITSVVSGVIPIGVGLALGERPSPFVLGGVCVAVLAIWLIAGEKRREGDETSQAATVLALGAGVFFGGYFVLLSRSGSESGLWPLVAGRTAAMLTLGLTILVLGYGKADAAWVPPHRSLKLSIVAGLLDATANALYFYASRTGLLSVVAVVASMYPASTILLARVAVKERVNRRRLAGMAVGLAAVSLIALGGSGDVSEPIIPSSVEVPNELVLLDPDVRQDTIPSTIVPEIVVPEIVVPQIVVPEIVVPDAVEFSEPAPVEPVAAVPEEAVFGTALLVEDIPAASDESLFSEPVASD